MARTKKEQSAIISALGVQMTIWQSLVVAVRENGGSDEDIYRLATPDGKATINEIAKLIARYNKEAGDTYTVTVDNGLTLGAMIKAGKYDWSEPAIKGSRDEKVPAGHFKLTGEGKVETEIVLVHLDRYATTEDVEAELEKRGLRAATIEELLALGAHHSELQRKFPIVALGSRCVLDVYEYVPVLCRSDSKRELDLGNCQVEWRSSCRFAAVRK